MKRKKVSAGDVIFYVVDHIVMFLVMLLCVYPFYYVFIYSISTPSAAQKGITFFPREFTLSNFAQVFRLAGIPNALLISCMRTLIGTVITIMCCSLFAYLVTKEKNVWEENNIPNGGSDHVFQLRPDSMVFDDEALSSE